MSYYNTLPIIDNRQLLMFTKSAETCKDLVLEIFKGNPNLSFTPYEAYEILTKTGRNYPKDSTNKLRINARDKAALIIYTWNNFIQRKSVTQLLLPRNYTFPKPI